MLTDPKCRNAKPKDKRYRPSGEKALYLEVMPNGAKFDALNSDLVARRSAYPAVFIRIQV